MSAALHWMTHCTDSTVEYCTIWFYPPLDPVSLSLDQPDCLFSWPHSVSIHSDLIPLRHGYFAIIMSVSIHSNPCTHLFATFYISVARDGINPNEICTRVSQVYSSIFNVLLFLSVRQIFLSPSQFFTQMSTCFFFFWICFFFVVDLLPHFRCCSLNLLLFFIVLLIWVWLFLNLLSSRFCISLILILFFVVLFDSATF